MKKSMNILLAMVLAVAILAGTIYKAKGIFDYERSTSEIVTGEESVIAGNVYDRDGIIIAYGGENGAMEVVGSEDFVYSFSNFFGIRYGRMKSPFYARAAVAEKIYGLAENKLGIEMLFDTGERGDDAVLTIQRDLNERCYAALREVCGTEELFAATAVVYNYKNGEILAAVNTPSFNLNDASTYPMGENGLLSNEAKGGSGSNKVTMEYYAPDSTFKPIVDAIAYEYDPGVFTEVTCEGSIVLEGETVITDEGHGTVDLDSAIAQSCNIYQESTVYQVPTEVLEKGLEKFDLNREGVGCTSSGMTFYTGAFDFSTTFNKASGILGEGETMVSPLQLARMYGGLINSGVMMVPKIVRGEETSQPRQVVSKETSQAITNAMIASVEHDNGTCRGLRFDGIQTCGKTGTSSSGNSCWCISGILDADYPVVVAVGIFGVPSATGAGTAQPAVRSIMEAVIEIFGNR